MPQPDQGQSNTGAPDVGLTDAEVATKNANADAMNSVYRPQPTLGDAGYSPSAVDPTTKGIMDFQALEANKPYDPDKIKNDTIAGFQSGIDALKGVYANTISDVAQKGKGKANAETAIQGRSGALGSTFGQSAISKVNQETVQSEKNLTDEEAQKIATIHQQALTAGDKAVADARDAKIAGGSEYLKSITNRDQNKATQLNSLASSFVNAGTDPSKMTTEQISSLVDKFKQAGYNINPQDITNTYKSAKTAHDTAIADQAKKDQTVVPQGSTVLDASGKTIASGAPKTQTVDVGGHTVLINSDTGEAIKDLGVTTKAGSGVGGTGSEAVTITDMNGKPVTLPSSIAPYYNTSVSGKGYIDASALQGTASEKKQAIDDAQKAGIKVITNKANSNDLQNIQDAGNKLDTISTVLSGIDQPSALERDLYGAGLTKLASIAQSDPRKASAGALQSIGLDILKAISGTQGFRGNATVVQQVTDHLPSIYDTNDVVQQKISYIKSLLGDREDAILGVKSTPENTNKDGSVEAESGPDTGSPITVQAPDGKTYTFKDQASADGFKKEAGIQ